MSLCVTSALVVWCFAGWILDKGWSLEGLLLAGLTGVFQCLGFNASAQMLRADRKGHKRAAWFWRYTLVVTAAWTAFSAHHGYLQIATDQTALEWSLGGILAFVQGAAVLVLLTCAASIEPLLGWAIEATEAPAVQPPIPRVGAAPTESLAVVGPRQPAATRSSGRVGRAVAAATIAATTLGVSSQVLDAGVQPQSVTVGEASSHWLIPDLTARARAMASEGISERRIVLALGAGITRHEVRKMLGRNPSRLRV